MKEDWNIPLNANELIDKNISDKYIPSFEYYLIVDKDIPDEVLDKLSKLLAAVLYLEKQIDVKMDIFIFQEIIPAVLLIHFIVELKVEFHVHHLDEMEFLLKLPYYKRFHLFFFFFTSCGEENQNNTYDTAHCAMDVFVQVTIHGLMEISF